MNKSTKEIGQPEQEPTNEQKADNSRSAQVSANAVLPAVFVVIKCGYEGIEQLVYASTDGFKCATKVKFLKAEISEVKLEMKKIGNEKWDAMLENDELEYDKYSMGKFGKEDAYCMQKFDGEKFDCCCEEFGVEPSETWLM